MGAQHPFDRPCLPAAATLLACYGRDALEALLTEAIDVLDREDGDPDFEGEWTEDELSTIPSWVSRLDGPGCPIADPGGQSTEDELSSGYGWTLLRGPGCPIADPDMAADDEPCDERDQDLEPEELHVPSYGIDQTRAPLSPHLVDDASLRRPHIQRIRRSSCRRLAQPDQMGRAYELIDSAIATNL